MATSSSTRQFPNILVVGTPGTGKTTTAKEVVARAPAMRHVEVGALVKDKQLHSGWDEEFECHIVDEDRVRRRTRRKSVMLRAHRSSPDRAAAERLAASVPHPSVRGQAPVSHTRLAPPCRPSRLSTSSRRRWSRAA